MGHKRFLKLDLTPEEENLKGTIENRNQKEKQSSEGRGALKRQSSYKTTNDQGKWMEGLKQGLIQIRNNESCLLELQRTGQRKQSGIHKKHDQV